jgi:hypothetical protein
LDLVPNQNAGLILKNDLNQRIETGLSGVGRLRDDDIDVCLGLKAAIVEHLNDVRFAPESGHSAARL